MIDFGTPQLTGEKLTVEWKGGSGAKAYDGDWVVNSQLDTCQVVGGPYPSRDGCSAKTADLGMWEAVGAVEGKQYVN